KRLTTSPGDDAQASWAPDGRSLVFGTVRWNPRHRQDLAVLDLETGRLRLLTQNNHSDLYPSWSPDGTRVAFVRSFLEMRPPEICWISVDARLERCTLIHGYVPTGIKGWYDHRQILAIVDSAAQRMLARVDLESQTVRVVDRLCRTQVISPDGRWGTCIREDPTSGAPAWYVFPLDRPDQARRVEFGSMSSNDFFLMWRTGSAPTHYLERIEIIRPAVPIPLDATHRLRVRGFDAAGHASDIPVLAWWSADTAIAAVDSAGTLEPKRVGTVTVHVSAGGWRHDSVRVTIQPPAYTTVLEERWTGNLSANWVPFGVPRPVLTTGPDGVPALWHRGDSTYHSGVYSTRAIAATHGLGMEALVSTPIDELQWQSVSISLDSQLDSAALANWDHRTGSAPSATTAGSDVCSMIYPRGDGFPMLQRVGLGAGGSNGFVLAEPWLRSGRWYTVRIQIFPDGRCGFAVDGQPLWRSDSPVSVDRLYRVLLYGKSVRTRILVGPLEVWEGVRGDVDWSVLDRQDAASRTPR
ncbi:MAG: PD40 domain-containing protein, partial [Gemmatimonadetes bacterium]|nr:PD40 domain-containing protein [Gemmatimonadota bacterium]